MTDGNPMPFFREASIDDLMRASFDYILTHGVEVVASRGPSLEITGALLELTNPRARLSRTHSRGKPFSALGELIWYLSGSNETAFISYYIAKYKKEDVSGKILDAYGPRLFNQREQNQVANVINLLQQKPTTRRAVIQLFEAEDTAPNLKSAPCTCYLQFLRRGDQLDLITTMRSNDALFGLPHDIFSFTMLQEIVACSLNIGLGTYRHFVGSFHLYLESKDAIVSFVDEGWQPMQPMPSMPVADPWRSISDLVHLEHSIRTDEQLDDDRLAGLDPYWKDLVHLLQALKASRNGQRKKVMQLRREMSSHSYDLFLNDRSDDPFQGSLWPTTDDGAMKKEG